MRKLDFTPGNLVVKAQRVAPTPLQESLFPVKAGEMFETGGLMMDTSVTPPAPLPSKFRFELTGPDMGDSNLIRWELRSPNGLIILSGNGNDLTVTFGGTGPLSVRFFLDRNSNLIRTSTEPEKVSETFTVVASVTHSLSFEYSSIIATTIPGYATPAERLSAAQTLADNEDDALQIKESGDDWRVPVRFQFSPSTAGGVFAVVPGRPNQPLEYDAALHFSQAHDVTFTYYNPFKKTTYYLGLVRVYVYTPTDGVTGSTGSALAYDAPPLTFVHELGHLYGSTHTAESLDFDGYLMHPGSDDEIQDLGSIGGVLRQSDAAKFYNGVRI